MATTRIHGAAVEVRDNTVRIHAAEVSVSTASTVRIHAAGLSAAGGSSVRVHDVALFVESVAAGADQVADPFAVVSLAGTPLGGVWSQVSGPAVTLAGVGSEVTFEAIPSATPHTEVQRVFRYSHPSGSDEVTVWTLPAMWFLMTSTAYQPMRVDEL